MIQELKEVLLDDFWIMPATPNYKHEGVPYITSKNIKNGKIDFNNVHYIDREDYKKISRNRPICVGDILISMIGTLGETAIVTESDGEFYGQNMFLVRLNENKINHRYFMNFFKSESVKFQLLNKQNKSTQSYLKANHIESLKIPIPSLDIQKERACKLDKIQEIIDIRKKQIESLDVLIKARFVELFGDYRINEKGFDCKKGSELFKFSSGKFLPEEKRLDEGTPVYGGNGIAWYTNEYLIDYPTIIIGRVGAQCGNIHAVTTPVWITDNAIYIKEQKTKAYTLEFLTELMRMMDFSQYADFSGQPKITQKPLETLDYIMPPIELQNEYTAFVKQTDKSKLELQKSLEEMQNLFDSLMAEYFG
ncbi:MAG: restriction endonuclease subunit S [Clostridia bacterium]|nr:restriction endonuclease subunit S [Clostridia bacterium]